MPPHTSKEAIDLHTELAPFDRTPREVGTFEPIPERLPHFDADENERTDPDLRHVPLASGSERDRCPAPDHGAG